MNIFVYSKPQETFRKKSLLIKFQNFRKGGGAQLPSFYKVPHHDAFHFHIRVCALGAQTASWWLY